MKKASEAGGEAEWESQDEGNANKKQRREKPYGDERSSQFGRPFVLCLILGRCDTAVVQLLDMSCLCLRDWGGSELALLVR